MPNYHFVTPSLLINAIIPMALNKVIIHNIELFKKKKKQFGDIGRANGKSIP